MVKSEKGNLTSDSIMKTCREIHARVCSLGRDEHSRREALTRGALLVRMQFPRKGGVS